MAISAGMGCAGLKAWAQGLDAVDFVLVREKTSPAEDLVAACRQVRAAVPPGVSVLVAGRVDLALAAELAGVHLGSGPGELRTGQVRALFPRAFVTVSCHTVEEVRRARDEGASAALFAPVFGKAVGGTEVVRGVGLERLGEACLAAGTMPVFALGGVMATNAASCLAVGAAGVAGIRLFGLERKRNG